MKVATINRLLPVEMLYKIFLLLSPLDLCSVVAVCRRWQEVGEDPRLWFWMVFRVKRSNIAVMQQVMAIRRLQGIRRLKVREVEEMSMEVLEELLKVVVRHPGIR